MPRLILCMLFAIGFSSNQEVIANTINTGAISPQLYCAGSSVSIPYTVSGNFLSINFFTAQLSNSAGSFNSGVTNIGTVHSTSAGTISGTIPISVTGGTNYRIRVIANDPITIGSDNGSNITCIAQILLTPPTYFNQTNVACFGGNTGIINVNPSGGNTPYSYVWSPITATSATVSNLSAGNYSVTVTDANGCTRSAATTITQHPQIHLSLSQTNNSCYGQTNGIINTIAFSDFSDGPYTYIWSAGSATTATISNLTSGNYSVTLTDVFGCTKTASTAILPPVLSVSISSQTNVTCYQGNNGALTVTGVGGTSGYTYLWSNSATTANISSLTAGNYSVTVTDAHNCTATSIIAITQPVAWYASISSQTNVRCFDGNTGALTATETGGTYPYSYSWSNNSTSANISGLIAGAYIVTITDAHSCTATTSATITQPPDLIPSFNTFPVRVSGSPEFVSYGGSENIAIVNVNGGTPAYTYLWSQTGGTTATISNMSSGTYTVTVTDANSCTATTSLCPYYYNRGIRMHAIYPNDVFLDYVFLYDEGVSSSSYVETNNLLNWIKINHFNKLIIDGIYSHQQTSGSCSSGYPVFGILSESNPHIRQRLSDFITAAKANDTSLKVFATIGDLPDRLDGTIKQSVADMDTIAAYNLNNSYTGKIDGFWIDYEFWDSNYNSNGVTLYDSGYDGCGHPIFENSPGYRDSSYSFYTEYGYKQFKQLIGDAETEINYVNTNCSSCSMQKPEVVIEMDMSFTIDETYPKFKLAYNYTPYGPHYFDPTHGSMTQGFEFARWLKDSGNIGSIAVDLSETDGRSGSSNPLICDSTVHDIHGCIALAPNHFLNDDVDNVPDDAHGCTGIINSEDPDHFDIAPNHRGYRQRCLDMLASFGNGGGVQICPYFSSENKIFNSANMLSNYMTADVSNTNNSNHAYGQCTDTIQYIPDIHTRFMQQFSNSYYESFVQNPVLYHDSNLGLGDITHTQVHGTPWWGAIDSIMFGTFEWFPINTFPLVMDNSGNYNTSGHLNGFFATNYPYWTYGFAPFMFITQNRGGDSLPDGWVVGPCTYNYYNRIEHPGYTNTSQINSPMVLSASIYPNPSDGNFILSYTLPAGKGELIITDITGRILYVKNLFESSGKQQINISNFNDGIYYWKIITGN